MADNETIADIIAEMRRPREGENACLTLWRDEIADRIEAAHKHEIEATAAKCCQLGRLAGYGASEIKHQQEPVGDAAKLREALVQVQKKINYLIGNLTVPNSLVASRMEINGIINAALAAPPRNCERFRNADEALEALERHCNSSGNGCIRCPVAGSSTNEVECKIAWLFAPATEKEGGNDAD